MTDVTKLCLLEAALLQVCSKWGIVVKYSVRLRDGVYGQSSLGLIKISERLNDDLPGRVLVLAHELGHEFIHHDQQRRETSVEFENLENQMQSLRAEIVSDIPPWMDFTLGDLAEGLKDMPLQGLSNFSSGVAETRRTMIRRHEEEEGEADMVPATLFEWLGLGFQTVQEVLDVSPRNNPTPSTEASYVVKLVLDEYRELEHNA